MEAGLRTGADEGERDCGAGLKNDILGLVAQSQLLLSSRWLLCGGKRENLLHEVRDFKFLSGCHGGLRGENI